MFDSVMNTYFAEKSTLSEKSIRHEVEISDFVRIMEVFLCFAIGICEQNMENTISVLDFNALV